MYKSNWPIYDNDMIENVNRILISGKVNQWTGSEVFDFEKKFSEYFGVKHSIAVFNGTVALELCLKAISLQPNDEVIVTARSFIASSLCINSCGGTPVFADVDENSQNITIENIKKLKTDKTLAVILVHLAGWPCDMKEIIDWCHSQNIYVIEDCAQAHGAKYYDKFVGTWGDINAWSFCQDKIISTGGEGGMVTTNNTELFNKAWSYKDHGKNYDKVFDTSENKQGIFKWVHDSIGTNWRMMGIQASIGMDSLKQLDSWVKIRRRNAEIINNILEDVPLIRLTIPDKKIYHVYYKYYCFIRPEKLKNDYCRNDIITDINNAGIPCFQGTCGEINKEKSYDINIDLPVSKNLSETSLMLLVDPSYSEEKISNIALCIKEILLKYSK